MAPRVLVSANSRPWMPESTAASEDAAALNAADRPVMEAPRVLVSASSALWSAEPTTVMEDNDALNVLDNADAAVLRRDVSVESAVERATCELKMWVANSVSGPISFFRLISVSVDAARLLIAPIVEVKKVSVASTCELYRGLVVKFHSPVAETVPPNKAFPTTFALLKDALAMLALLMLAAAMDALLMVASPMLAVGMVAVPVKTGLSMGAFSKFKEASPATRSVIS